VDERITNQQQEPFMATTTANASRTAHLLALMKKGDDAFNARDVAGMDAVHHPNMLAYVTGNAEPIYGRAAHAAAMKQFVRPFPDVHVHNDPYPIQFGSGDWITVVSRVTGTFTARSARPRAPGGRRFAAGTERCDPRPTVSTSPTLISTSRTRKSRTLRP
jgi:hypothetical protein